MSIDKWDSIEIDLDDEDSFKRLTPPDRSFSAGAASTFWIVAVVLALGLFAGWCFAYGFGWLR